MWFKVGDELTFHPRVLRAGNAAIGLWVRAGTFCSEHLSDGWLSHEDARTLGTAAEIKKLVAVGLWYEAPHEGQNGYQFHRWATNGVGDKRQPTRAEIEADREKARQRQERWRSKRADENGEPPPDVASGNGAVTPLLTRDKVVTNGSVTDTTGVSNATPSRPVPSRPVQDSEESLVGRTASSPDGAANQPGAGRGKRAHLLPARWVPTDSHRAYAATHRLDIDDQIQKFRDYHAMKGTLGKDWDAGFRTWLSKAVEYRDERESKNGGPPVTPRRRNLQENPVY